MGHGRIRLGRYSTHHWMPAGHIVAAGRARPCCVMQPLCRLWHLEVDGLRHFYSGWACLLPTSRRQLLQRSRTLPPRLRWQRSWARILCRPIALWHKLGLKRSRKPRVHLLPGSVWGSDPLSGLVTVWPKQWGEHLLRRLSGECCIELSRDLQQPPRPPRARFRGSGICASRTHLALGRSSDATCRPLLGNV